jgi:hypothetical protein
MRALKLLAIAAVCPLVATTWASLAGCERIVQPVGTYEGSHPTGGVNPAPGVTPDGRANPPAGSTSTSAVGSAGKGAPHPQYSDAAITDTGTVVDPPPEQVADAGGLVASISGACTPTTSMRAELRRLDMYIVMDANITLPFTGLWEFATTGLRLFATDPRSQRTGVGLRFFGLECDPTAYDKAQVEVDVLSNNASAIVEATKMRLSFNASPMGPALEGGIMHQSKRAKRLPDTKQIVVLLTDGFTQDITCFYSEQRVEMVADNGFVGPPAIETHVIGFGLPATPSSVANDILARFLPLDAIATQGGGGKALTLQVNDDPALMNEALQTVRRTAQPCEYLVPAGADRTKLSLGLVPGGELPRVDDASVCGGREGWYYDAASQNHIVLCPMSCQPMQRGDSQTAQLLLGCPPKLRAF